MRWPDKGLMMKRCAVAGLASAAGFSMLCAAPEILRKRRGERQRIAGNLGPAAVGAIFARAADRHLHQHGGKRREDHEQDGADNAQADCCGRAPPKNKPKLASIEMAPAIVAVDRHHQRVAIADMGELMGHDAGNLVAVQHAETDRWWRRPRHSAGLRPVAKALGCGLSMI